MKGAARSKEVKPPAVAFRSATLADRAWLFELKRATMRVYVERVYGWDEAAQRQRFDEQFDPTRIRVIQCAGRDAGLLEFEEQEAAFFLARIEVLPAQQNRGIGSAAIRSVIEQAAQKGKGVWLQVLRPNPARMLYERLGFVVFAETATHFKMTRPPPEKVDPSGTGQARK